MRLTILTVVFQFLEVPEKFRELAMDEDSVQEKKSWPCKHQSSRKYVMYITVYCKIYGVLFFGGPQNHPKIGHVFNGKPLGW